MSAVGIAFVVLCLSLSTAGGGALVIRSAYELAAPSLDARPTIAGAVIEVLATPCVNRHRPGTCYRPVVAYTHRGTPKQVTSRSSYRPAPYRKGDAVAVVVDADGEAWMASEWDTRQDARRREYVDARRFRLVIGWLLVGCGGVGVLLAVGLAFAKRDSDDA